jgi:hypothetical protein
MTIKQFLKSKREQSKIALLQSLKVKDCLGFDINKLTYNEVRACNRELRKSKTIEDTYDVFDTLFKITKEQFFELDIVNYFQTKKFIEEKFISLAENESKLLNSFSNDDIKWQAAGGDKLKEFGDVLPLDRLAKLYGGYPFDYGERKYIEIIYLLRMNMVYNQVEKEYNKMK